MRTLGEELPREITRVRDEVMPVYMELSGGTGDIALAMMRADLDAAARAMAEGDVIAMMAALRSLRGYTA
jgi:hypothetical protein